MNVCISILETHLFMYDNLWDFHWRWYIYVYIYTTYIHMYNYIYICIYIHEYLDAEMNECMHLKIDGLP